MYITLQGPSLVQRTPITEVADDFYDSVSLMSLTSWDDEEEREDEEEGGEGEGEEEENEDENTFSITSTVVAAATQDG